MIYIIKVDGFSMMIADNKISLENGLRYIERKFPKSKVEIQEITLDKLQKRW